VQDSAENEHHGHHPRGPHKQGLAASKFVDTNNEEDTSSADLDCAINASSEQRSVGFGYTNSLEDLRRIVTDGVYNGLVLGSQ